MTAITCMHLVEHLHDAKPLMREAARLLRPGGRIYFETPHPKTLGLAGLRGKAAFTMNFYDDLTHVRLVTTGELAELARCAGLEVIEEGTSRNWVFAASHVRTNSFRRAAKNTPRARIAGLVGSPDGPPSPVKPKLLVLELWNVGDLAITTPFLRAACEKFEVTLLAKPFAADLVPIVSGRRSRWPRSTPRGRPSTEVHCCLGLALAADVHPAQATAPGTGLMSPCRGAPGPARSCAVVAERARARLGFPRIGSHLFLTRSPAPAAAIVSSL